MSDPAKIQGDLAALNELIVNCPDFDRLETLLGGFNLFQVLKFEHGEIRHSNVLAWILDPSESHGLDATFLKKWLMRVIHESPTHTETPVSAVDIDAWQLVDVEVRREWRNIDLLLILRFANQQEWVICIENKIRSTQHSDQLRRYRTIVEDTFPSAERRIFIFLTMDHEVPKDQAYLAASYAQVHRTLQECLQGRIHSIGSEPRVLMENYLRLLEEKFMNESEIARTALRIYQQHRRALDVIFEHRPDNLRRVSEGIRKLLAENAVANGMVMEPFSKAYIRFTPSEWNQPGNTHGKAWAGTNRNILVELILGMEKVSMHIMAGQAPEEWIEPLWQRAAQPPFRRLGPATRPPQWCALHRSGSSKVSLEEEELQDPNAVARKVYEHCLRWYQAPDTQEVIRIIAAELPRLQEIHSARISAEQGGGSLRD